MYNLDNPDEENEPLPYLYTHDLFSAGSDAPTDPFPTQPFTPVTNPVHAAEPMDLPLPLDHDAQPTNPRELYWALVIASGLLPIFGVMAGGFGGLVIGGILGMAVAILGFVVHLHRMKLVRQGHTEMAMTQREINAHNAIAIGMGVLGTVAVVRAVEHHRANLIAQALQQRGFGS